MSHSQAVWLMVAVTAMWSIAGLVSRQLEQAHSFEVTFWRSLFTTVTLLVLLPLWQGRELFTALPWRSPWFWLSGFCWSVMFTAFMVALMLSPVAQVLITMASGPLITALLARLFLGYRLPGRTWVAITVAAAGIVWIYGDQLAASHGSSWLGFAVALCVPVAGAVQWTVVQHSQRQGQALNLLPCVLVGAALSSALTFPLALPLRASSHDLAWLALLGVVQLALPCCLAVICARVLRAPEVSLLALLEVVFGIVLVWLGAAEAPAANVVSGGAMVIAALVLNEWLGWRQQRKSA